MPDDVSIVGFDDIPLAAYFDPPLTTVRLPAFELGQAAGRALLERIADRAIPHRTLLPTELIVRGSTTRRRRLTTGAGRPAPSDRPRARPDDRVGDPGKEKRHGGAHIGDRGSPYSSPARQLVAAACSSGHARRRARRPVLELGPARPPASAGAAAAPAPSSGGGDLTGQSVTVIGTWTGAEEKAFHSMVTPWEASDRREGAVHRHPRPQHRPDDRRRVGRPARSRRPARPGPDGPVGRQPRSTSATSSTSRPTRPRRRPPWSPSAQVNGKQVGVFIKTAIKGLIWFDPKVLRHRHDAARDLGRPADATSPPIASKAKSPWCLGLESGAASGWPGTDWIEDIVLRQAGPDVYQQWYQGKVKWTDPAIKTAWTTFGDVVTNSFGGSATVNATNFANAGDPLFKTPPGCMFLHQASFITGLGAFKTADGRHRLQLLPVPRHQHRSTPGPSKAPATCSACSTTRRHAKSLMAYLVTAPAQDIWVKIGGALSANKNATDYPDDISKRSAAILTNAKIFALRRLRPDAVGHERRVLEGHRRVHQGPEPARLDPVATSTPSRGAPTRRRSPVRPARWERPVTVVPTGRHRLGGPSMDPRLVTAIIVVVGVPAVLIGYIVLDGADPAADPGPAASHAQAMVVAAAGAAVPDRLPRLPDDRHDHPQLPEHGRDEVRRPRQLRLLLHQPDDPRRPQEQLHVGRPADAVHGRLRADHRGPGRPRAL